MSVGKWLAASVAVCCLFALSSIAIGDEPGSASADPASVIVAAQQPTEALSPNVRTSVRHTAMSLLNRAGAKSAAKYGLTCEELAEAAKIDRATDKPYVILVHGFNSSPERCATLLEPLRGAGLRCGTLRYPNDQSITESAELLSDELKAFAKQKPDCKVTLLTYSMGGLVAREAIENTKLDPGNVTQLIMIAPPSHGSSCARIVCSGDIWEHGVHGEHGGLLNCVYACVEDGLGEARHDLKPDSPFLKRLNARQRNERVRYSILLGTGGPFSPAELELAKKIVCKTAKSNRFVETIQPALDRALDDLTDAVEEGDGVVSVARGRLDGVSDTVLLGFSHWNVIDKPDQDAVAAVHREILKRLDVTTAGQAALAE
jgi:pimeloyl-ACP methyl ester carboxylesterase